MKPLCIIGCGWHGREVLAIVKDIAGPSWFKNRLPTRFVDRDTSRPSVDGVSVLSWAVLESQDFIGAHQFVVAIGDNQTRTRIGLDLLERGAEMQTVVHPSATMWTRTIGVGTVVFPQAIVSVGAQVGRFCIVNKHATVGHGAFLGDGVNLADATVCSGNVGDGAFLGMHAVVLPGVSIGARATVGAGAVVTKDVPDGVTVTGIPARVR